MRYRIAAFIADAKRIMADQHPLAERQADLAERLAALSRNDDLLRSGLALGPADASTQNYLLWREAPHVFLGMAQFDEHYVSPVHEHDHYWVIGCGYRGRDRWDMYERQDDGSDPGFADLTLFDRFDLAPGQTAIMPPPPRAVHAHNNLYGGTTLELIFSMAEPSAPDRRLIYDVEDRSARLSQWKPNGMYVGADYPGPPLGRARAVATLAGRVADAARRAFCPVCAMARAARALAPAGA
jgi:hypothetical protein